MKTFKKRDAQSNSNVTFTCLKVDGMSSPDLLVRGNESFWFMQDRCFEWIHFRKN